jgi:hypothetical protein
MGLDLGKIHDFTVINVADVSTGRIVYFERFNKIDWDFQRTRVADVAKRYNDCVCYIDSTGIGDPIVEDLQRMDVICSPYKFTVQSKYNLVKNLNIMVRGKKIYIPTVQVMIDELSAYTFKIMEESGLIKYGAPDGMHDDCVSSVMLAAWGLSKNRTEVVGEMAVEQVPETFDISQYGSDEERYCDWYDDDIRGVSTRQEILNSLRQNLY